MGRSAEPQKCPLDASAGTTVVLILVHDGWQGASSGLANSKPRRLLDGQRVQPLSCISHLITSVFGKKKHCVGDGDPQADPVDGFLVPNIWTSSVSVRAWQIKTENFRSPRRPAMGNTENIGNRPR